MHSARVAVSGASWVRGAWNCLWLTFCRPYGTSRRSNLYSWLMSRAKFSRTCRDRVGELQRILICELRSLALDGCPCSHQSR
jgi:hypothetical protein